MSYYNNNKSELEFPYSIEFCDPETNAKLLNDFKGEKDGFVQIGDHKWFLPSKFKTDANHLWNFEARPDDVWIVTYPRSGTTWCQELIWLICNDLNYDEANRVALMRRFPFFEFHLFMHKKTKDQLLQEAEGRPVDQAVIEEISEPGFEFLPKIKSRRFIKTHLPLCLLPPSVFQVNAKIVYVARNPLDVAVSYYHLNKLWKTQGYQGDFEQFYNYFERDLTAWSPYWKHLKTAWSRRTDENVLFMFYEDIVSDLSTTIKKVGNFLGHPVADHSIPRLVDHLSIENFKHNPMINMDELKAAGVLNSGVQGFVRNGKTGGWNEEFTPELLERCKQWMAENLKDTDMRFPLKN